MSDSDSDVSFAVTNPENSGKWPISRIRLLIQLRLEMETEFRGGRSRHLLWPQIYSKLKSVDPSLSETLKNVQKKFNNLMLTYKRIKASSRGTQCQSRWEFFEDFDGILSQFGETNEDNDQTNVRYVKVEKLDDDSVSFSSDDCGTPSNYRNVVTYKQESPVRPTVAYDVQTANGIKIKPERNVVQVKEPAKDTKKRKLIETVDCKVKTTRSSTVEPNDDNSWFREYVQMCERREQLRHEQLLEMERKRLEIETKKMQVLRELVDVVKKFVNK